MNNGGKRFVLILTATWLLCLALAAGATAETGLANPWEETTAEDVRASFSEVKRLSELTKLPILFTSVKESLLNEFEGEEILPLRLQNKII